MKCSEIRGIFKLILSNPTTLEDRNVLFKFFYFEFGLPWRFFLENV